MAATTWEGLIRFYKRLKESEGDDYPSDTEDIRNFKAISRRAWDERIALIEVIRDHPDFVEIVPGTIMAIMTLWLPGQDKAISIGQPNFPNFNISMMYLSSYQDVPDEPEVDVPLQQAVEVLADMVRRIKAERSQSA